ncbi:MAG: hypothetical protein US89_C0009G0007 [Candidatus Peregrinibacteria bacterium GW2011_GWF2_38_29]|nr:MAG: hypothetical protein US89_C0009G0007 [Candidatus Peregrinibacteria bacterium GW2011_GWF2_38_29]HBB02813.1 hypothetical protein [Candidatus Peregrinibacteria bacterium]
MDELSWSLRGMRDEEFDEMDAAYSAMHPGTAELFRLIDASRRRVAVFHASAHLIAKALLDREAIGGDGKHNQTS